MKMINIFIVSAILGIWCTVLFFGKSIGLSMLLFIVPFTYYIIHKLKQEGKIVNEKAKLLMIPIILLSSTYCIYNNRFFNTVNIFAIILLVEYMIYKLFNDKTIYNFKLIKDVLGVLFKPLGYIETTFDKLAESLAERKKEKKKNDNTRKIGNIAKAIAITFPLVLVIIILLASADEVFGSIFSDLEKMIWKMLIQIKLSDIIARILLSGAVCIYLLIFFSYILRRYKKQEQKVKEKIIKNDNLTIKVMLGALNVVYLIFCIIQVKSLFMRNVDINYADYARQGFFQLMIVSLINLITILIAKKSENNQDKKANIYVNTMCIVMIIFTIIILVSAAVRMYFYASAYGYTLLRLLVYCVLFTEAILLIPTIAYILNIKMNLPKVYIGIIMTVYICMNFANFDAVIAKRNVDRFIKTGKIDIEYLIKKTDTDAVKDIIRLQKLEGMTSQERRALTKYIDRLEKNLEEENMDFRNFNISKMQAKKLISNDALTRSYKKFHLVLKRFN